MSNYSEQARMHRESMEIQQSILDELIKIRTDIAKPVDALRTYVAASETNYGERTHVVNAESEEQARAFLDQRDDVWDGYTIQEVGTTTRGVVAAGGELEEAAQ